MVLRLPNRDGRKRLKMIDDCRFVTINAKRLCFKLVLNNIYMLTVVIYIFNMATGKAHHPCTRLFILKNGHGGGKATLPHGDKYMLRLTYNFITSTSFKFP